MWAKAPSLRTTRALEKGRQEELGRDASAVYFKLRDKGLNPNYLTN